MISIVYRSVKSFSKGVKGAICQTFAENAVPLDWDVRHAVIAMRSLAGNVKALMNEKVTVTYQ